MILDIEKIKANKDKLYFPAAGTPIVQKEKKIEYIINEVHCTDDGGDYVKYAASGIVIEKLGKKIEG